VIVMTSLPLVVPVPALKVEVPPALNVAGVHWAIVALPFPPFNGGMLSFEHTTLDFSAAAGNASGTASAAPAAIAKTSAPALIEILIMTPLGKRGCEYRADNSGTLVLCEVLIYQIEMTYSYCVTSSGRAEAPSPWEARAAERSPLVQRSRSISIRQARVIIGAARRLMERKGEFTTQELAKEAGVALQTFYRHFASKDELLLAVIEDLIREQANRLDALAADIADPVARLRLYVTSSLQSLSSSADLVGARSITAEHWRLHQLFPDEMEKAVRPFVDLVHRTLLEAQATGQATPIDAARDAWLMVDLVRSVFHTYAFAPLDRPLEEIAEHTWSFCLRGIGGHAH
jgi:AcrR family transcriptional regulator